MMKLATYHIVSLCTKKRLRLKHLLSVTRLLDVTQGVAGIERRKRREIMRRNCKTRRKEKEM